MNPEQALEHFQNLAECGGVQIYPLDDLPSTKNLAEQIADTGRHILLKRVQGNSIKFERCKPLVIVTNANQGLKY